MKTMSAMYFENGDLSFRKDIPVPVPNQDEALVRVTLAGICGTDLEIIRGYYPFTGVLGHEFVGVVVEAPGQSQLVGGRVVGEINIHCGHCKACRNGLIKHCQQRSVLGIRDKDGAFAQYLTLPTRNLHNVPDGVSDDAAVFTEPLAAALAVQQQVKVKPDDKVMVIGAGRLGQLIAQTLSMIDCELCVVCRYPRQVELLNDRAITVIKESDIPPTWMDIVVESTGSPQGLKTALQSVRPMGTVVLKSTYKGPTEVNLSPLVVNEINLIGSRCGPFPPALSLLEEGVVSPESIIDGRFSFSAGQSAFEHAGNSGALKVLLHP